MIFCSIEISDLKPSKINFSDLMCWATAGAVAPVPRQNGFGFAAFLVPVAPTAPPACRAAVGCRAGAVVAKPVLVWGCAGRTPFRHPPRAVAWPVLLGAVPALASGCAIVPARRCGPVRGWPGWGSAPAKRVLGGGVLGLRPAAVLALGVVLRLGRVLLPSVGAQ